MSRAERIRKQAQTPVGPIEEWWRSHPDKIVTRAELWEILCRYDAGVKKFREMAWWRRVGRRLDAAYRAIRWFLMRPVFTLPKYREGETEK